MDPVSAAILALAILAAAFILKGRPMADQNTLDVVAQLEAARAAYDAKIASAFAAGAASVQPALDAANATIASITATLADNLAAVKAEADALTADASAPTA